MLCGWGLVRGPIARRLGYALAAGAALLALFALRSEALIFVVALALTGVLVLAAERPGTALCASLCGLAGPYLKAAAVSRAALDEIAVALERELRITMFAAGCGSLAQLQATPLQYV